MKPGRSWALPAPDRVELGGGVEAGLVGLDDPDQPVAVEVAVGGQPVVVADDRPAPPAGSPTAIRHAQASTGGWMLAVIGASGEVTL